MAPKRKTRMNNQHNALAFSKNCISTFIDFAFWRDANSPKEEATETVAKLLTIHIFLVCCDLSWLAIHFISLASDVLVLYGLAITIDNNLDRQYKNNN